MSGLSSEAETCNVNSELPGECAPQRLACEVHAIHTAIDSNEIVASKVVIDILQATEKILGECVPNAASN
jgi:hypothetical protein